MSGTDALYERIAAGIEPPALSGEVKVALLDRAGEALGDANGDWDAALRVAVTLGGWRAAGLLREAVRTGPFERAALALEWAPAAGSDGETALAQGLECQDEALVLQALSALSAHRLPAGTSRARRLLAHPSTAVRVAALQYLGLVAGPAVVPELRALLAVPALEAAARLAIERADGRAERPAAAPFPRPALRAEALAEPVPEEPPAALPEDAAGLLALLARTAPARQPALVEALRRLPEPDLAAALRPLVAGSPVDRAVGGCRYAEQVADPRWRLPVRRLLGHASPRARLAAARAMARIAGDADRPALQRAAADPSPEVRAAAAEALERLAEREGAGA